MKPFTNLFLSLLISPLDSLFNATFAASNADCFLSAAGVFLVCNDSGERFNKVPPARAFVVVVVVVVVVVEWR